MTNVMSRDSSVGIATGHGLDDREVGVRVPVGQEFSLLHIVRGPPNGYRGLFARG
jgi:hypothetical protein